MTTLRVGLVGMGRVARDHLEALRGSRAVEVVGVYDHARALGHLQIPLEDGARLLVQDQLSAKLLERAFGKRSLYQLDARRHFPLQIEQVGKVVIAKQFTAFREHRFNLGPLSAILNGVGNLAPSEM